MAGDWFSKKAKKTGIEDNARRLANCNPVI